MKITLESLLKHLVNGGTRAARASMPESSAPSAPTSIRLKPVTKHFLDCQATALNTSVQSLISMILDGVAEMTLDNQTALMLQKINERFFTLFQAHEIDLPGIVSVMKEHGFTLSALGRPDRVLDLLDQESIQYLAKTFFVRPEWISGARDLVIGGGVDVRWYKNVYGAGVKLLSYAKQGLKPHVMFIRRERADFAAAREDNDSGTSEREPIGIVVRLFRKTDDGVNFTVYEVWEFERWNYSPCREQIKLLIAFCGRAHGLITYDGYELPAEDIKSLVSGSVIPSIVLKISLPVTWYPDDYASIKDEVTKEMDEWPSIQKEYERGSRYEDLINEARCVV